jgi:hypothetical protein
MLFIMSIKEIKLSEQYVAPDIEVLEIELTQNILQQSGEFNLPDYTDGGPAW